MVRSGALSLGPKLEQFEHDFSDWIGGDVYAIAVSSGTAALHLGVRAEGWSAGDEVITSSLTFVASANCLLYEGVKPVFCDIDPVALTMDTEAVAAAVGERTAGILPVHIFGYPADLPALRKIASERDLGLLEDACQALGAHDSTGKKIGTDGNLVSVRLLRQQADDDGGGGNPRHPGRGGRGTRQERAQPGAGHRTWDQARARSPRVQLPAHRPARGDRDRAARAAWTRCSTRARTSRPSTASGSPSSAPPPRASKATTRFSCPARTGATSGAAGSSSALQLPEGADRDGVIAALGKNGIASKGLLALASTCCRPIASASASVVASSRSLNASLSARSRCPFFTAMTESQVEPGLHGAGRGARPIQP